MARGKHVQSRVTKVSTIDENSGEIVFKEIETEKVYTVTTPTEEFFQVYVRLIASVYELKYANDIKILIKFCEIAEFNTGIVMLPSPQRSKICDEMGMQSSNLSKSLKRLKDKGLIDGEKGLYTINPAIFWKGEQKVRHQVLKDGAMSVILNFKST